MKTEVRERAVVSTVKESDISVATPPPQFNYTTGSTGNASKISAKKPQQKARYFTSANFLSSSTITTIQKPNNSTAFPESNHIVKEQNLQHLREHSPSISIGVPHPPMNFFCSLTNNTVILTVHR